MDSEIDLKFDKIKAIQFGELKVRPKKLDKELELRLRALDLSTESGVEEAIEVMADCFEKHKSEIQAFMRENMTSVQLSVLQAYLVGGKQVVEMTLRGAMGGGDNA